ncbi:uncharacterized protein LOC113324719 [Papaver somniferum]|uniref:uncharacterized protein LOC113324719 n=1 Tax=Papaver somniferum TaxID=3469 RepID=UPI000E6FDB3C|nr:uncharacterized protein LOC113324719 [Papaver somniferum]
MQPKSIDSSDNIWLERNITDDEMLSALKKLGQDRPPGPMWLNRLATQIYISTSLIPKKEYVEKVKDLRHISLTNSVYKAIYKVLAERLKTMLHKLVSNHQSAFVEGRQILDSVLIENACLDSRLIVDIPGVVYKMDLDKAFDNVKWVFLIKFSSKWVLVTFGENGLQGVLGGFHSLFLSMEALAANTLAKKAAELGWIGVFQVHENGTKIGHFQFADNTLVFLDADIHQIRMLKYNLMLFEYASGLHTNFGKRNIFVVGNVVNLNLLASFFGCSAEALPSIYLGIPLEDKALSSNKWDKVIEIYNGRLAFWKGCLLSKADFPSKKIWTRDWPHKVAFFLWKCALIRLSTLDNLYQRNSAVLTPSGNAIANIWRYFFLEADRSVNLSGSTIDLIKNWPTSRLSAYQLVVRRCESVFQVLFSGLFGMRETLKLSTTSSEKLRS